MNKIIKILIIILALLLVFIFLMSYKNSFSSFFSKITGTSNTQVATPIFIIENSEKKILNDENTEIDYYFTIKNYENHKRSQTDLKYTIEILPSLDKSIILTLYKDGQKINLTNQKTDEIEINYDNNYTHSYRLNVKYDRERTNATTDIKENIFIKASANQS